MAVQGIMGALVKVQLWAKAGTAASKVAGNHKGRSLIVFIVLVSRRGRVRQDRFFKHPLLSLGNRCLPIVLQFEGSSANVAR
jgi:hypothetical protein